MSGNFPGNVVGGKLRSLYRCSSCRRVWIGWVDDQTFYRRQYDQDGAISALRITCSHSNPCCINAPLELIQDAKLLAMAEAADRVGGFMSVQELVDSHE